MPTVPVVSGLTVSDATNVLAAVGYSVTGRRDENSEFAPPGTVIDTEPPGGSDLEPGEAVGLVVSLGPQPPAVPDVVGLSGQQAVATLQSAGYQVSSQFVTSSEEDGGRVVSQDPGGGTGLFPPGPVTIFVGSPPVPTPPPPGPEQTLPPG